MKILDLVAMPLRVPQKGDLSGYLPYRESLGGIVRNAWVSCFVKVTTDEEGLFGTGESLAREVPEATAAIIERLLKPVIVGRDPREIEVLWELMYSTLRTRGHNRGYFVEALSGVDIALWDLMGKAEQRPVYELLGGAYETNLKAYASSVLYGTPKEMATECLKLVEEGHDQIKVKVGMGEARDAENLKAIRDAIGYDIEIMVDANSAYSPYEAIRVGRKFERYECFWFEEPVPPDDINGCVEVARSLDIPIAGGESHSLRYDFRDLLSRNAIDVAMPDAGRAGGISECRKIAILASAFDKKYSPHVGLSGAAVRSASLHLAASMSKNVFLTYEYYHIRGRPNPLSNDVVKEPVEVFEDGHVEVPHRPGLGVEIDEKVAKNYATAKL